MRASKQAVAWLSLLLAPTLYASDPEECPAIVAASQKLSEVPGLRAKIEAVLRDPSVPGSIQRIILSTLQDPATSVVQLTRQIRELHRDFRGIDGMTYAQTTSFRFFNNESETTPTFNQSSTRQFENLNRFRRLIRTRNTVFVPDRPLTTQFNDLLTLIHELAHIRFDAFLDRNLPRLARRFPETLIRKYDDGTYAINRQFFDFLTERYAHLAAWRALESMHGIYFPTYLRSYQIYRGAHQRGADRLLSYYVIRSYTITDPAVTALRDRTLSDLLLDGVRQNIGE